MNVCPSCGYTIYPEDNFCGQCGKKITVSEGSAFLTQSALRVEDVRTNLGMVYYKMGNMEKAIEEFRKVLKANPDDAKARQMLDQIMNNQS